MSSYLRTIILLFRRFTPNAVNAHENLLKNCVKRAEKYDKGRYLPLFLVTLPHTHSFNQANRTTPELLILNPTERNIFFSRNKNRDSVSRDSKFHLKKLCDNTRCSDENSKRIFTESANTLNLNPHPNKIMEERYNQSELIMRMKRKFERKNQHDLNTKPK